MNIKPRRSLEGHYPVRLQYPLKQPHAQAPPPPKELNIGTILGLGQQQRTNINTHETPTSIYANFVSWLWVEVV